MIDTVLKEGTIVYTIFEVAVIGASIFYIIFAFVILKQVNKMTQTLEVGFEAPIKFFALVHLLLAITTLSVAFLFI